MNEDLILDLELIIWEPGAKNLQLYPGSSGPRGLSGPSGPCGPCGPSGLWTIWTIWTLWTMWFLTSDSDLLKLQTVIFGLRTWWTQPWTLLVLVNHQQIHEVQV